MIMVKMDSHELKEEIEIESTKRYSACRQADVVTDNNNTESDEQIYYIAYRKCLIAKVLFVFLISICVVLLSTVIVLGVFWGTSSQCKPGYPVFGRNLEDPGIFDELTIKEYEIVKNYLLSQPKLNIVEYSRASINNSYIYLIDLHIPLKAAVLRILERGDKKPKRSAKAILFRGDLQPPRVEEYHIGPLPVPEYFRLVTNPSYTTPRISFSARPVSKIEYDALYVVLNDVSEDLYGLLYESYGLSYHNCTVPTECIVYHDNTPRGSVSGDRITWFSAFRNVDGMYLHPLGFNVQIKHDSVNTSDWAVEHISYNNQVYQSVKDLLQFYTKGILKKTSFSSLAFNEYQFSSYVPRGKRSQAVPLQGPQLVEPEGRRYHITGNHVKYMNWDFEIRIRPLTGLQIYDIRFQEERIVYELSLQDIVIFNSGHGPSRSSYLTSMLMGNRNYELVPGVDCPDTAIYLDSHIFADSSLPKHYNNVICVFEQNGGIPLRRHTTVDRNLKFRKYEGSVNYFLIVRTITSLWNVDFILDHIFYQNGAIEVKISRTGYLSTTFGIDDRLLYGSRVHEHVLSNIEQHLFHYKIDLDINGENNRFAFLDTLIQQANDPYVNDKKVQKLKIQEHVLEREHDIIYEENTVHNRYNVIFNQQATSKFGSRRSYRILNLSPTKLLLENDEITNSARWAKYPIAVTQQNDAEEMSTSIYAQNDPWDPVVDFDRFLLNNESTVDVDLVAWVAMGSVNIPNTEDVPSIATPGNMHSFMLLPFNYFTECPSVTSNNVVSIFPESPHVNDVNTYGTSFESTCVQKPVGPSEYSGQWKHVELDD